MMRWWCSLLLMAFSVFRLGSVSWAAPPPPPPPELTVDAELADIFFVDADVGFVVGDRGVILRTDDGGRRWRRQESGVGCRLESVFFLDADRGWAVGGWSPRYSPGTSAVVLRTFDGGRRWTQVPRLTLPALVQVRFFDTERGWAAGPPSAMYPSGVFHTEDGGRSWSPVVNGYAAGWTAADFADPRHGIVASDKAVSLVGQAGLTPARLPSIPASAIRAMRLAGRDAWLVGDGGLVLHSADGGANWAPPLALPAEENAALFDFRAVATIRDQVWIAGSPGGRVFHSVDAGRSWEALSTGSDLPINAITFFDANHGWAVGPLGTILATRDGGRTWRKQRSGGNRAALLAIPATAQGIPWELLSEFAAEEGYQCVVDIPCRRAAELPSSLARPADRALQESLSFAGASYGEQARLFPLPQAEILAGEQRVLDIWRRSGSVDRAAGDPQEVLVEWLVRRIRQWRPDVVVAPPSIAAGDGDADDVARLVGRAAARAVQLAADPRAFPEHQRVCGLSPWQAKKLYAPAAAERSDVKFATTRLATRLGRSIGDHAASARVLFAGGAPRGWQAGGLRLVMDETGSGQARRDLFGGLSLAPGGDARRPLAGIPPGDLESLRRAAQRRQNTLSLIERSAQLPQGGAGWLAQLDDLTAGLDRNDAAQALFELALEYERAGRPDHAAETWSVVAERFGESELATVALMRLVAHYASLERALQSGDAAEVRQQRAIGVAAPPAEGGDVAAASFDVRSRSGGGVALNARLGRAAELAKRLEALSPPVFAEPQLRLALAAAHRKSGRTRDAEALFQSLAGGPPSSAWTHCAEAELWLAAPRGLPPKPVIRSPAAAEKPFLDGLLDEEMWREATPLALRSPLLDDAAWPSEALVAWDAEHLYLAARCRKTETGDYSAAGEPRPRDGDLSRRDRVEFLIDVDRDYNTWYRLAIDCRGWTGDSLGTDKNWDPTWFVAVADEEDTWSVEAAIPLAELVQLFPQRGDAWAVGAQRIAVGDGFQSWSQPASAAVLPAGFGLLQFAGERGESGPP